MPSSTGLLQLEAGLILSLHCKVGKREGKKKMWPVCINTNAAGLTNLIELSHLGARPRAVALCINCYFATFPQDNASPLGTVLFYLLCCQWDRPSLLKRNNSLATRSVRATAEQLIILLKASPWSLEGAFAAESCSYSLKPQILKKRHKDYSQWCL